MRGGVEFAQQGFRFLGLIAPGLHLGWMSALRDARWDGDDLVLRGWSFVRGSIHGGSPRHEVYLKRAYQPVWLGGRKAKAITRHVPNPDVLGGSARAELDYSGSTWEARFSAAAAGQAAAGSLGPAHQGRPRRPPFLGPGPQHLRVRHSGHGPCATCRRPPDPAGLDPGRRRRVHRRRASRHSGALGPGGRSGRQHCRTGRVRVGVGPSRPARDAAGNGSADRRGPRRPRRPHRNPAARQELHRQGNRGACARTMGGFRRIRRAHHGRFDVLRWPRGRASVIRRARNRRCAAHGRGRLGRARRRRAPADGIAGRRPGRVRPGPRGGTAEIPVAVESFTDDGRFVATAPLRVSTWGGPELPPRRGAYALEGRLRQTSGKARFATFVSAIATWRPSRRSTPATTCGCGSS